MKILHVNSLYYPLSIGGAERSLRYLAEAQLERGNTLVVVTLSPEPGVQQSVVGGVKVYAIGLKNLYWPFRSAADPLRKAIWHAIDTFNPSMAKLVAEICDAEKPDVVNTHNLTGFSVAVWKATRDRRLPVVHTLRDYSLLCPRVTMFCRGKNCEQQHMVCRAYSLLRVRLSQSVNAVTSVSRFVLDRHLACGAFTRVASQNVIHNFRPRPIKELPVRGGGPGKPITVGYIGQLTPVKGIELFLEAAVQLGQTDFNWLIAGRGEARYERRLKERFGRPGISFLGFSEPGEFYLQVDLVVVPSLWHDPRPSVVIEAFGYGVPVVASRRGGISEMVADGSTGYLFEPTHLEELLGHLRRLRSQPERLIELRANCFDRAGEFSAEHICDQFDSVYLRAIRSAATSGGAN